MENITIYSYIAEPTRRVQSRQPQVSLLDLQRDRLFHRRSAPPGDQVPQSGLPISLRVPHSRRAGHLWRRLRRSVQPGVSQRQHDQDCRLVRRRQLPDVPVFAGAADPWHATHGGVHCSRAEVTSGCQVLLET